MLKNFIVVALRNIRRNPQLSIINIGGLAIGLACTLVLYLYVSHEFGYDTFYKNADRIFRVYTHISLNGAESNGAKSSPPVAYALRNHFPEVEANTLVGYEAAYNIKYEEKAFREYRVYMADSNYFKVFNHTVLKGDAATALLKPNSVVMTESTARRYFGDANPIGKQMVADDSSLFVITAVIADFPANSHFNADMLLSLSTLHGRDDANWLMLGYSNYVMLRKGTDFRSLEQKLKQYVDNGAGPQIAKMLNVPIDQFRKGGNAFDMKLQPLIQIYLYSRERYGIDPNTEWGHGQIGNITYVRIFIATALLVLLIAVFNFMNIATARSEKKAKETGIRKTLGSARWQLVYQYYTEAILTAVISVMLALGIAQMALPWFNQLTGKAVTLSLFSNPWTIPALAAFTLIVGLLSGSYPAFFLSAFQPVETLKGMKRKSKNTMRSVLVVSQFAISIALIIGMMAVRTQLNYMQNKDLGIKSQQLITINNGAALGSHLQAFRQEMLKNPAVVSVTNSSLMFAAGVPESAYSFENTTNTDPVHASYLDVDEFFVPTLGIQMKEGRSFDASMPTDSMSVVINETAARMFAPNANTALGKQLIMLSNDSVPRTFRIIGITKDFNFESLHQQVKPLVMHLDHVRQAATYITIKYSGGHAGDIRKDAERAWNSIQPFEKCNFNLFSDTINNLYKDEKKVGTLAGVLSGLAVFVACLGLFGLAMFVTEQRRKEIGVRKVLGASVPEVTVTISKQFVIWIGFANLLAWPLAYLVLYKWFQNFAYHVQPAWWMFLGAGLITLFIAMATVGTQSIKAALANPIKSLRTD